MKILILGAEGMLGYDLVDIFRKNYQVYAWGRGDLDITSKEIVQEKIFRLKPEIVINAAAFTDVDGCETKKEICHKINGQALEYLSLVCNRINALFIHYSTDYVFRGDKKEGYKEDDKPDPINEYGKSKLEGEKNILNQSNKFYIIRTSWLYGKNGRNFVNTMLNLAKENDKIEVINDQFGKPTYTKDLAFRTKEIIEEKRDFGIYHITNEGITSWYKFARKIFELAGIDIEVKPVSTEQFPRPAKRPQYSALINTKLPKMRRWEEALEEYLTYKL